MTRGLYLDPQGETKMHAKSVTSRLVESLEKYARADETGEPVDEIARRRAVVTATRALSE